jgi:hypothetical protein
LDDIEYPTSSQQILFPVEFTEAFEDDDDVFTTVDHKVAQKSEPDLPPDEYAKSTKIK